MSFENKQINTSSSTASFMIKKLGFITVKGTIGGIQGEIALDENKLEHSSIKASVNANTIDTNNKKRDEHLINEDFFNVDTYPQIKFESSSLSKESNRYVALGKLTIMGQSKEVSLPFTFKNDVLKGQLSINRKDFDLGKKFPSFFIGNNVDISIEAKVN